MKMLDWLRALWRKPNLAGDGTQPLSKTSVPAEQLIENLKVIDFDVVSPAVVALGKLKCKDAVNPLYQLFRRVQSYGSIVTFRTEMGSSRTTEGYFARTGVITRLVIEALGEIGGATAINALKNIAGIGPDYHGNFHKEVYPVLLRSMQTEAASTPPDEAVFAGDFTDAVQYGTKAVAPLCARLEIEPLTSRVGQPFVRGEIILALTAITDATAIDCLLRNLYYELARHSVSREYRVVFQTVPDVRFVKAILEDIKEHHFASNEMDTSLMWLTDAVRLALPQLPDDILKTCATIVLQKPSYPTGDGGWATRDLDCSQLHEMAKSEISRRQYRPNA